MASKKTPEINGGSMADIAFLMLIFFLMVTTMDSEEGISRRLPPMPAKDQKVEDLKINRRNVMEVRISKSDKVYAGGKYLNDASQLEELVIEFFTNPTNSDKLPAKKMRNIEGFGEYPVSEGTISLQNDRGTSYKKYIEVQNALVKGINTLRDKFARQNWGKNYIELGEDEQKIVREAIPQRISEAEPIDVSKKR